jgi:hypothetical protein
MYQGEVSFEFNVTCAHGVVVFGIKVKKKPPTLVKAGA